MVVVVVLSLDEGVENLSDGVSDCRVWRCPKP